MSSIFQHDPDCNILFLFLTEIKLFLSFFHSFPIANSVFSMIQHTNLFRRQVKKKCSFQINVVVFFIPYFYLFSPTQYIEGQKTVYFFSVNCFSFLFRKLN